MAPNLVRIYSSGPVEIFANKTVLCGIYNFLLFPTHGFSIGVEPRRFDAQL